MKEDTVRKGIKGKDRVPGYVSGSRTPGAGDSKCTYGRAPECFHPVCVLSPF